MVEASSGSVQFSFSIQYTALAGTGTSQPTTATIPADYVDPTTI